VIGTVRWTNSLKLAEKLHRYGIKIIGTSYDALIFTEDRGRFQNCLRKLIFHTAILFTTDEALKVADKLDFPYWVRPSHVLGGQGMKIVINKQELEEHVVDILRRFLITSCYWIIT
jgi:carbamoyl-phosphate synthase large subunit